MNRINKQQKTKPQAMMGALASSSVVLAWMILLLSVNVLYGWVLCTRPMTAHRAGLDSTPSTRGRQQPAAASSSASSSSRRQSATTSSSSSSIPPPKETEIPANLKRKVRAKRPFLGHIVPKYNRRPNTGGSSAPQLRAQGQQADYTKSQLRIAAGTARGRKIDSPNVVLRPMMGKVKEAVFSTLTSVGVYETSLCRHLDVFAGSGNVGLESLSRGATECTFVDFSTECCACIQRNLDATGLGPGTVVCQDAFIALQLDDNTKYHVVTICPPYEEVVYADLLQAAIGSPMVMEDTIIVIEYPVELLGDLPHVITANNHTAIGIRNRRYGRTVIAIYIIDPTGQLNAYSRPEEFVPSRR
jgi:16S rRNA (guanine966-N2)-methyltransferase